jgi:cell division transport system ATP-binding protein
MIRIQEVTKYYPGYESPALHDVTIHIEQGEFVFLVGPSGSGKTTLIRLLLREILPTKGEIEVAGIDVIHLKQWKVPYLRRNIGCVFQDFKLLPNKTVFENVAFALEVLGKRRSVIESQVPEVLRLMGLEDKTDKFPHELSGGEQQRVSMARAIVNRPPILLADEPTGNLDPAISVELMALFDRINRLGTTVLVATHDREMVDSMRKRVVALDAGRVIRDQKRGVYGYEG